MLRNAGMQGWYKSCFICLIVGLFSFLAISPHYAYSITTSGAITGEETWEGTVFITGDVTVTGKLTILPGTIVKFDSFIDDQVSGENTSRCELIIKGGGNLVAEGTTDHPITFTSITGQAGEWYGIVAKTDQIVLRYAVIEYAINGIFIYNTLFNAATLQQEIEYCTFKRCINGGYLAGTNWLGNGVNSQGKFTNCLFTENQSIGICVSNSTKLNASDCTVTNNSMGIGGGEGLVSSNRNIIIVANSIIRNNNGIGIKGNWNGDIIATNCTIDGNKGNGVESLYGQETTVNDCIINNNGGDGIICTILSADKNKIFNNSGNGINLNKHGKDGVIENSIYNNKSGIVIREPGISKYTFTGSNNIFNNTDYELYNAGGSAIIANGNYWGEPTTSELKASKPNLTKVFDSRDDAGKGAVTIKEWSEVPFPDPQGPTPTPVPPTFTPIHSTPTEIIVPGDTPTPITPTPTLPGDTPTPTSLPQITSPATLLLEMDNVDSPSTFIDSSVSSPYSSGTKIVTSNGNVTQLPVKFNRTAGFFNGTSDFVLVPNSTDWDFGTGEWTIESFVNFSSLSNQPPIISIGESYNGEGKGISVSWYNAGNQWTVYINGSAYIFSDSISTNIWYHILVRRSGNNLQFYRDAVQKGSNQDISAINITGISKDVSIGRFTTGYPYNYFLNGWLKELRISNISRSVSVPVSQYSPDSNTKLLMHFDSPAEGPLGPAMWIVRGPNDGDDWLEVAEHDDFKFGTGEFSVEFWINNDSTIYQYPVHFGGAYNSEWYCGLGYGQYVSWGWNNGGTLYSEYPVKSNTWYHYAVTRDSSNVLRIFVNGHLATYANSHTVNYSGTGVLSIGSVTGRGYGMDAKIRNLRIVKGLAMYTSDFTPPQSDLTVPNATTFLAKFNEANGSTSFTDYGMNPKKITTHNPNGSAKIVFLEDYRSCIFMDETGKHPYPQGSAKIDFFAAQGNGVGYFGGNGDYLSIDGSNDFSFGIDNFTLEFFMRIPTTSNAIGIMDTDGVGSGFDIQNSLGIQPTSWGLRCAGAPGTTFNLTTTLINTWSHYAFVRNEAMVYLFVNGTLISKNANNGNITNNLNSLYIGKTRAGYNFSGNLDNIRITKGIARYTSSFNPPEEPIFTPTNTLTPTPLKPSDTPTPTFTPTPTLIPPSPCVEPTLVFAFEFDKNKLPDCGWSDERLGGFSGNPAGVVKSGMPLGDLLFPASKDKRGLMISVAPSLSENKMDEVCFVNCNTLIETRGLPVLIVAYIQSDNADTNASIYVGALKGDFTKGGVDGSISYHAPANSVNFTAPRRVCCLYEPDGDVQIITPFIQIAAKKDGRNAIIYVDRVEIYLVPEEMKMFSSKY